MDLSHLFSSLSPSTQHENLLIGFQGSEDAAVFKIDGDTAIVLSADFITPVVDDPYMYGMIAAANALSDVFAMGAEAKVALNLLMWDKCHVDSAIVQEILNGGLKKIEESGAVLGGGHSIADKEQKYGLSVMGVVHPQQYWRNNTPQIGDALILTKPLGSGIISTAIKRELASVSCIKEASFVMQTLNVYAMRIAKHFCIHACTDITGFGLIGHALEMLGGLEQSNKSIIFNSCVIPIIEGAYELMKKDIIPGGSLSNYDVFSPYVDYASEYARENKMLFFDAQTSGGLLLSLAHNDAQKALEALKGSHINAYIIGEVVEYAHKSIILG